MIHILAIGTCVLAFACLCAAMARHQKDFVGRSLDAVASRRLRRTGAAILLVALAMDLAGLGAGYGAVAWCGHLTVAAAGVLAGLNLKISRQAPRSGK